MAQAKDPLQLAAHFHNIAEGLTEPKDVALVRQYAAELAHEARENSSAIIGRP